MRITPTTFLAVLTLFSVLHARGDAPAHNGRLPDAYYQKIKIKPDSFQFKHSFLKTVRLVQINRQLALTQNFITPDQIPGGLAVSGKKTVYVVPILYSDSGPLPYPSSQLQKELFGSWPTGTMADFYRENSYGRLQVEGTVMDWKQVSKPGAYYAGPDYIDQKNRKQHCYGLCEGSKIGELLTETLDAHPEIDWGPTDNDGPDGKPNSGDDDGFVDFVAFVHPGKGGECGDNQNIWSHRGRLSDWLGNEYTTKTDRFGGGKLKIDDYVVMPALACDGSTMIQIGVFAHEFGHAFGLPDLYDTSQDPKWNGLGNWDLMAAGGWGGDDHSPELPTHMSTWSKEYLGWVDPVDVDNDLANVRLKDWETTGTVYRMRISPTQYYLITSRQPRLFDAKLPGAGGLLIEYVNEKKVQAGLTSNTVNNDVNNKGVAIVEADGIPHLDDLKAATRANPGDLFPGPANVDRFDSTSPAKPFGLNAVCKISRDNANAIMVATFQKSSASCPTAVSETGVPSPLVTLSSITQSSGTFTNKFVRVRGTLIAQGTNYFIDMVVVLTDGVGNQVYVQIPRPLHVEHPQGNGRAPPRPSELSDLLGKRVELQGRLSYSELRKLGKVLVLRAETVAILDK